MNTPLRNKQLNLLKEIQIPPSPQMKKLGFGTGIAVYKLNRKQIASKADSPWALKKLHAKGKENEVLKSRLVFECEILKKLTHPNIVGFRGMLQDKEDNVALALEHCSTSLGDMIDSKFDSDDLSPFPADNILKMTKDVTSALEYLHNTARLLHCDIKSYNVLIKGEFDICKLCDFGVSVPLQDDGFLDKTKVPADYMYDGTLAWCAPEVLRLEQTVTDKADIYALGLTIWEMLALVPPPQPDDIESFMTDDSITECDRERPELPDVNLDSTYDFVLEIYYLTTESDFENRPNAKQLALAVKDH